MLSYYCQLSFSEYSNSSIFSSSCDILSSPWSILFMRISTEIFVFELLNFSFPQFQFDSFSGFLHLYYKSAFHILHCLPYFTSCWFVFVLNSVRYLYISSLILLIILIVIWVHCLRVHPPHFNSSPLFCGCYFFKESHCLVFSFYLCFYLEIYAPKAKSLVEGFTPLLRLYTIVTKILIQYARIL
jgi:hypothetical protein